MQGNVPEKMRRAWTARTLRELLEDDQREHAIHAVALRNAADRLDEIP